MSTMGFNPSWGDLQLFLAIARSGTLSGAGKIASLSLPTVGRRLRDLERNLAQPLLQRSRGGYSPTKAGQTVLDHARRIESEIQSLSRRLQEQDTDLSGHLRIAFPEWFGKYILTQWLVSFCDIHSNITIEHVPDRPSLSLCRREADVIFRSGRFGEPNLIRRFFTNITYGAFAASEYINRYGAPDASTSGSSHRLIVADAAYADPVDGIWLMSKLPGARSALQSNNYGVQIEACRHGAGIAVLPRIMTNGLDLIEVDLGDGPRDREIWVGFHPEAGNLISLQELLRFPFKRP